MNQANAKPPREIKLTNTMSGKKEILQTRVPGKLTFYSCGPTVYNFIHIGNLRGGLVADMFYRYFKRAGYDVIGGNDFSQSYGFNIVSRDHDRHLVIDDLEDIELLLLATHVFFFDTLYNRDAMRRIHRVITYFEHAD